MGAHKHGRNMASTTSLQNNTWRKGSAMRNGSCSERNNNNNYKVVVPGGKALGQGHRSLFWSQYGLVAAAALLCYSNGLTGDLVHDDVMTIKTNPDVRPDTPLSQVFLDDFWGRPMSDNTSHKSYRPLCILTFRLNYLVHGLDPLGYHVVNLMLHVAVSLMFTYTCNDLVFSQPQLAGLAGLMFATHPIHTEAVTGIVGRADVLAGLLFLISFLCYNRSVDNAQPYAGTSNPLLFVASLLSAACAMLVKEHGLTVLAVSLLYDSCILSHAGLIRIIKYRCIPKEASSLMKRALAVIITLLVLLVFRLSMMHGQEPNFMDQDNPASFSPYLLTRLLTYLHLYSCNVWLLLCPTMLSYDWQMHSIPLVQSISDPRNVVTLVFIISMITLSMLLVRRVQGRESRQLLTGLALLVIPFLPAANIFLRVGFVLAERLLYIPSMGYVVLCVHGLERLMVKFSNYRRILYRLVYILCVVWACRTLIRNQVWYSRSALFRSGLQTLPHNAKMHYNYANYLKDIGSRESAKLHYRETLRLWPRHASASNNLGTLMSGSEDAMVYYRQAIKINPRHAGAHFNLGNTLFQLGRPDEALTMLKTAVEFDSGNADAHTSLAAVFSDVGDIKEAERHYLTATYLNPTDGDVFNNYGVFLNQQKRFAEALVQYQHAFSANNNYQLALINAAKMCRKLGRNKDAEGYIIRATDISRDPSTLDYAGVFYFNNGQGKKAFHYFQEALQKDPGHVDASIHYAQALSGSGEFHKAEQWFNKVLHLTPHHVEALHQLGNTLGMQGKHRQAIKYITEATTFAKTSEELSDLYFDLGNHYKDAGDLDAALQAFLTSLEYIPDVGEAHLNLGVLFHFKGNLNKARHHYTEAKRIIPNNPVLTDNLKKLEKAEQLTKRRR